MSSAAALSPMHRRLRRRNGIVRVLRLAIPLLGALVLFLLLAQLVLSSLGSRFSVGQITVSPDAITVEAPEYVGLMQDGSTYRVSATSARAAIGKTDIVDLSDAQLVLDRADGVQLTADAASAQLDGARQLTLVPGLAEIADSTGTMGTLRNSVFDLDAQTLTTEGEVVIDYADGSSIRAEGLVYDAANVVWTFTRSTVTLPFTPGEAAAPASARETEP